MTSRRPARLRVLARVVAIGLTACSQAGGDPTVSSPTTATSTTRPPTTTMRPPASTTSVAPTTTAPVVAAIDVFSLRPPAAAADPGSLVAQIVAAETTLRDPAAGEGATAEAALAQQVAYRQLGAHPEWDAEVLGALPEPLPRVAELHVAARREFRAMHTKLSGSLPAWHIVPPAPYDELVATYAAASAEFGIPWQVLAAVNLVETGIGRIRGTSVAGAQGPMQFMPATWDAYGAGGDINDTHDAVFAAARYLAANNGATDIANALYRYNHSDHYVLGVRIYADLIAEHPRAFLGFYGWGIWYLTDQGEVYLPVGYEETAPVPVADYLAR
jgi:membrane-bound lytic murein transglycosylase B